MKKPLFLLLFIILIKIPVILNTQLTEDEAYYWVWSKNISLSYYDHPPVIAYLIKISTTIFGNSETGVRFFAIFLSFLTGLFLILIGKELKDHETSFNIILFLSAGIIFSVGSVVITPDTPLIFFSVLSYYFLLKYYKNKNFIYLSALSLGLALLSKYTAFLLAPSFLYFFYREKIFFKKERFLFALIALLVFSPVIIWNIQNNFVSFKFQFSHGIPSRGINLLNTLEYLRDAILVLSFPLSLIIFYYSFKGLFKEKLTFLTLSSFVPFLFFSLTSLKFRAEANWPVMGYIFMLILAGLYLKRNKIFWTFFSISFLLNILVHIHAIHPFIKIKKDPVYRMKGWREITMEVEKIRKEKNIKNIAANTYQWASILSFYLPDKPFVPSLNIGSRQNHYYFWKDKFFDMNKEFLFVGKLNKKFEKNFSKIEKLKDLNICRKKISVYILRK